MVFHTAPPHPASKARITCSPVFVGGAEASQNGFGDTMPAKFTARLTSDMRCLQSARHRERCPLAICYGIHNFAAAIHAISTGKIFRIRRLPRLAIDHQSSAIERHTASAIKQLKQRRLPDGRDDEIAREI